MNPAYRKPGKQRDCESQAKEHPNGQLLNLPRQQQYKDDLSGLLHTSDEALDTDNESIDPDFIDEKNGYLQLTQEEYDKAKNDSTITRFARELFEYGEAKEGYWTADKLMKQIHVLPSQVPV